jgi:E1A/CREB-binding protein
MLIIGVIHASTTCLMISLLGNTHNNITMILTNNTNINRLIDCTLYKNDVKDSKKKHSDEAEEVWVQCSNDDCQRWAHILCALFNRRRNVNDDFEYLCPPCLTERKRTAKEGTQIMLPLNDKKTSARDLPHNVLSQFVEARIYERLETAYKEQAAKLGIPVESVEKCGPIYLRQVSSFEKMQPTKEGMLERYQHKNYPKEFPVKIKCLVLFQNIEGQDVLLFGMYVYEYGHKCPLPNQRKVYISYLDSVTLLFIYLMIPILILKHRYTTSVQDNTVQWFIMKSSFHI